MPNAIFFQSDALSSEETEVGPGPKLVECPEDDEFLNAFERMVSDNIQDRLKETIKPQQVDISVPLHIKGNTKKTYGLYDQFLSMFW